MSEDFDRAKELLESALLSAEREAFKGVRQRDSKLAQARRVVRNVAKMAAATVDRFSVTERQQLSSFLQHSQDAALWAPWRNAIAQIFESRADGAGAMLEDTLMQTQTQSQMEGALRIWAELVRKEHSSRDSAETSARLYLWLMHALRTRLHEKVEATRSTRGSG